MLPIEVLWPCKTVRDHQYTIHFKLAQMADKFETWTDPEEGGGGRDPDPLPEKSQKYRVS